MSRLISFLTILLLLTACNNITYVHAEADSEVKIVNMGNPVASVSATIPVSAIPGLPNLPVLPVIPVATVP